jgi:NifU-like protein involved in Fe-S cluster formation
VANTSDILADDALTAVYNQSLIALSSKAAEPKRLTHPDLSAHAVSPICGSEVTVDLALDGDRITAFGFDVEACALTKAVVAVMAAAIIGKTRADVAAAGAEMAAMLSGKNILPGGDWAELKLLAPVKDYTARHNSILLPFEAVEKAFSKKRINHNGQDV